MDCRRSGVGDCVHGGGDRRLFWKEREGGKNC